MDTFDTARTPRTRTTLLVVLRVVRLAAIIFAGLVTLVVLVAAFLWAFQSRLIAQYTARNLSGHLLQGGYRLEIDDVRGSPFGVVALNGVRIAGERDTLFAAAAIRARYPIDAALRGRLRLERAEIDRPRVRLVRSTEGGLVLPFAGGDRRRMRRGPPEVRLDAVRLSGVKVTLVDSAGAATALVDSLDFRGRVEVHGGAVRILAEAVRGALPFLGLRVDSLATLVSIRDDNVVVADASARVGSSRLSGNGVVTLDDGARAAFDVVVDSLYTADIWPIVDLEDVFGHGVVVGPSRVETVSGGVRLDWDLHGTLEGDAIDRLAGSGVVSARTFELIRGELVSGDVDVAGSAAFGLVAPFGYHADLRVRNVDLTDVPVHGALVPLHPHRITGRIHIEGDDYTRPFPKMDVTVDIGAGVYAGVPFDSLLAFVSMIPGDVVRVHRGYAELGDGRAWGRAEILPDVSVEAHVTAENVPLERFRGLVRRDDLSGTADAQFELVGDPLSPQVRGRGFLDTLRVAKARLTSVTIDTLDGVLVPFSARVEGHAGPGEVAGRRIDSIAFRGVVGDSIRADHLVAAAGDTVITVSGALVPTARGIDGRVSAGEATLPFGRLALTEPMAFSLGRTGAWSVGPARMRLAGGRVDVLLETRPGGRTPTLRLRGTRIPILEIAGVSPADSIEGGLSDFDLEISGFPLEPVLSGEVSIGGVRLGGVAVDSVHARFRGGADSLRISDLDLRMGQAALRLDASLRGGGSPLRDLLGPDPRKLATVPGREVDARVVATAADLALIAQLRDLLDRDDGGRARRDVSDLFEDERGPVDFWKGLEGRVAADVRVGGPLADPEVRARLVSDSVDVRGQHIDGVEIAAVYRDSVLTLSQCDINTGGHVAQITGFVPCRLSLAEGVLETVEREMSISVELAETPFSLLSVLFPELIVSSGRFTGSGEIEGTPSRPVLDGEFDLAGGGFRWAGRREEVWDARAKVHLSGSGLSVTSFDAKEERHGRVHGSGRVDGPHDYRFEIVLEDFRFFEDGVATGIVDGKLDVSADVTPGGRPVPRLDGRLQLKQGQILGWGAPRPEGEAPAEVEAIYDLVVDVGRLTVATSDLQTTTNFTVGDGELTVRNFPERLRLGGTLEILEGSWTVFNNQFRIRRGTITFTEVEGVDPMLDIVSETRITGRFAEERGVSGGDARIVLTIGGRLSAPEFTWSTVPEELALTQSEILQYLAYGRYTTLDGSTGGPNPWIDPTADLLLNLLSQDLARLVPGVDNVEVRTEDTSPAIHLVKSLTDELTIGYTTNVSRTPDQELSIEARLSNVLFLRGGVVREQLGTTGDVGGKYNLDLQLKFEY
jgi:hypothetical protein